ncbi:MAG TPA: nitrate reductase cytochrome c-type subunit [Gallionella sp.]
MRNRSVSTVARLLAGLALIAAGVAYAAGQPIKADDMGLSKESVFAVPTPVVYHYGAVQPGEGKLLPRAYLGAPPQISHDIGAFLPITSQNNMCIACHDQPGEWGKKPEAGTATPMPPSHYTDLRNAPGKVTDQVINARYNCNQCHVPQTDAPTLVGNTFSAGNRR